MPPEIVSQAFEPFFSTKGPGHGMGLGLSMVYGFVKQSGGHIRIESKVDHGTAVKIYLPKSRDAGVVGADAAADQSLAQGTETILLVEDNEMMREASTQMLESLGYQVIAAANGAAGLDILGQEQIHLDLLLTDIVMPGQLDGYQLARHGVRIRPALKVLLTSGFPAKNASRQEAGSTEFTLLRKPHRFNELATQSVEYWTANRRVSKRSRDHLT
jgi:CheY-like chemotaxis protein